MPNSPSRSELVDTALEKLVASMCQRPGMFVNPTTLGTVCAFIDGYNEAQAGGPLMGLHQWLVLQRKTGNNVHWTGNLHALVRERVIETATEEVEIAEAGRLLQAFFDERSQNGLTKIFHEFAKWQLRRSWYEGPLRSGTKKRSV